MSSPNPWPHYIDCPFDELVDDVNAAYAAAAGFAPGALNAFLIALACALAFFLLAHVLFNLWDDHQSGQLLGQDFAAYAVRATMVVFLTVFLLL